MHKAARFKKRNLLIPVFLLGLAALTGLSTYIGQQNTSPQEALEESSIYNSGPSGYRAWYLAAQKAGLPIQAWENPLDDLETLPVPATMLIVQPYTVAGNQIIFGQKDVEKLLRWVGRGNSLVLLDDFTRNGSHLLATRLMLSTKKQAVKQGKDHQKEAPPQLLSLLKPQELGTYLQAPVVSDSNRSLQLLTERIRIYTPLLLDDQHKVRLWKIPYRNGTFFLGTVPDLASNRYLHKPTNDNHQFLANLLSSTGAPIYINEFVHGYQESGDLLSYLQKKTPLGGVFAQFTLFFCMLLWLSFVRWTPKPTEKRSQLAKASKGSQEAYIQSMAGLFFRSKSSSLALSPLLNQIEQTLSKRFRLNLDEESRMTDLLTSLLANYSSTRETPESLMAALRKSQAVVKNNEKLSGRDLLKLCQQLTVIEERLSHGTRGLRKTGG